MSNRRKSQAERDAKRSRAHGHQPSTTLGTGGFQAFDTSPGFEEMFGVSLTSGGFNRSARQACSVCSSPVEWVDEAEAQRREFDVDQAKQFIGAREVEVWFCTSPTCDQAGALSV